jgi:hypothetical protein
MVAVLLRLRKLGIVGLPIHDAVLCRRSEADTVADMMTAVAEEAAGCRLPVTVDAEPGHGRPEDDGTEEDDLLEEDERL